MARFHNLTVTDINKTIQDAVVVTLAPDTPEAFDFIPGQYLTFKQDFDGQELRRNYSISSGIDDEFLQVGIKRVDGGTFSTWANQDLKIGGILQAMPPTGTFHIPLDPNAKNHYLGFAGGSGITPILSILKTRLKHEAASSFTLVYANRGVNSIMFRDEIEDLKNTYMGRFNVIHILESDAQEIDLFTGRLDAEKCAVLFSKWINISSIDTAFICGPEPMMLTLVAALKDHGLKDTQIKFELFGAAQPGLAKTKAETVANTRAVGAEASVIIDGTARAVTITKGQTILEAALAHDLDAPFACRAGVCSTCKCKVLEGEVDMRANHALEDYEVEQGYVLSCQGVPVSAKIVVEY